MIYKILTYPENKDILTNKSEEFDFNNQEINIKEICKDLIETLKDTKTGVGISAIQVGIPYRVCIVKYNGKYFSMINPKITRTRGVTTFNEGCLSAPGKQKLVQRAQKVWCTYYDINGNEQEISEGGLCSIIIQHELDHFEGWCEVFDGEEIKNDYKK